MELSLPIWRMLKKRLSVCSDECCKTRLVIAYGKAKVTLLRSA